MHTSKRRLKNINFQNREKLQEISDNWTNFDAVTAPRVKFRAHSHSGDIRDTFKLHSRYIQVTFTVHSSDIQTTIMIHSVDI